MVGLWSLALAVEIPSEDPLSPGRKRPKTKDQRPKTKDQRFTIYEVNDGETGKVAILDGETGARELLVG